MPNHLCGAQMVGYLQDKKLKSRKKRTKQKRKEKYQLKEAVKEKFQEREERREMVKQKKCKSHCYGQGCGQKVTGAEAVGKNVSGSGQSCSEGNVTEASVESEEGSTEEKKSVVQKNGSSFRKERGTQNVNISSGVDELCKSSVEDRVWCLKCLEYECND
uniref:Uncharacterized protein n=1 Tax=Amphimedon queenslandica TaxID=400682 RepID=A0A1X7TBJ5_AMPQE